jgi:hypothetical protein
MSDAPVFSQGETIQQLFATRKFQLPYYQREYSWSRAEVTALLNDLRRRFLASWKDTDDVEDVHEYDPYFLGSLVYYESKGFTHLVDGQQRVTTLHLLLIHLRRLLDEQGLPEEAGRLMNLIWYQRRFRIGMDERADVLTAISRAERPVVAPDATPSVRNLVERSNDLAEDFPHELRDDALLPFVEWLQARVCVVVIRANNTAHGWEIFETVNDRGVRPTPVDLLKSHLLAEARQHRDSLNDAWRGMLGRLSEIDPQGPSDYLKAVVVARYLDTLEDAAIAEAASSYPEWFKENTTRLGLLKPVDYRTFIGQTLVPLAERYAALRYAAAEFKGSGTWSATLAINQLNDMPHQLTAVLATLDPGEDDTVFHEKARLVANFLDLLYVRRMVNRRVERPADLAPEILALIPALRECRDLDALRHLLAAEVNALQDTFAGMTNFGLSAKNKAQVRYLLNRITAFAETGIGKPDPLADYLRRGGGYDIEHIWAGTYDRYRDVVGSHQMFGSQRNRLGALLLLSKLDNHHLGDDPYDKKVQCYRGYNIIAASLHQATYQRNPNFSRFIHAHGLAGFFQSHPHAFDVKAIEQRQTLYQRLCDIVWDPARLGFPDENAGEPDVAPDTPAVAKRVPSPRRPRRSGTPITQHVARLVHMGVLHAGEEITGQRDGETYRARILADGRVELDTGEVEPDISKAASTVLGKTSSVGWDFWCVVRDRTKVPLSTMRNKHLPKQTKAAAR